MPDWQMHRNTGRRHLRISKEADWELFDALTTELPTALGGKWVAKLDGVDQRYWDLESGRAKLTLHLEHYLGVFLFVADDARDDSASERLLDEAYELLQDRTSQ